MYDTLCRHNQELEQDALATEQEKAKLQQEADSLAEQLNAVLHDKFAASSTGFDADTPIDKTMKFLQSIIMVSFLALHSARQQHSPAQPSLILTQRIAQHCMSKSALHHCMLHSMYSIACMV